jgi:hypothetical protein
MSSFSHLCVSGLQMRFGLGQEGIPRGLKVRGTPRSSGKDKGSGIGWGGRQAGFSAAQLAKARAASVEMTILVFARERTNNDKYNSKDEMRGFFAALRMTTVGGE